MEVHAQTAIADDRERDPIWDKNYKRYSLLSDETSETIKNIEQLGRTLIPTKFEDPSWIQRAQSINAQQQQMLQLIRTKYTELDKLEKALWPKDSPGNRFIGIFNDQLNILTRFANGLNAGAAELDQERKDEQARDNQLEELDKLLQVESAKRANRQANAKKQEEAGSLDDFLQSRSSEGDSKLASNQLDDSFLTGTSNEDKKEDEGLDFLAAAKRDRDQAREDEQSYEIESKFDDDSEKWLYGVVNKKNERILIPYGDWRIDEYKQGIAKVSTQLVREKVCSCRDGDYYVYIKRVGFVDKTGNYLDTPKIEGIGGLTGGSRLVINRGGSYDKEAREAEFRLQRERCVNEGEGRLEELLSRYN